MTPEKVLVVGPNGAAAVYRSIRAASRVLSGNGSSAKRRTITRRLDNGGGFIGDVFVQPTNLTGVHRPR